MRWHSGVYEEVLRVPLIAYDPRRDGEPGGDESRRQPERVAGIVRHIDVLPTVLAMVGVPAPALEDAVVLPPFGEPVGAALLYAEHPEKSVRAYALRQGNWKVLGQKWRLRGEPGGTELYDLAADPGELRNLAASDPARVREMMRRLDRYRTAPANAPSLVVLPDESTAERLRSLGYSD
jgi:arylsulfatase A-like enzyme